jgi:signal transduction histidine kinase
MRSSYKGRAHLALLPVFLSAPSIVLAADGQSSFAAEAWPFIALGAAVCAGVAAFHYRRKWAADQARMDELRAVMGRQSDLLGSAPVDFISWSHEGAEEVSSGFARIVGRDRSEKPGSAHLLALFAPDIRTELKSAFQEFRDTGLPFERVLDIADGSRTLRLVGGAGRTMWITDATVNAAQISALESEAAGLRQLLDFLPIPLWRRDENLEIDYANETYRNAVEAPEGAAPGSLSELGAGAIARGGRAIAEEADRARATASGTHHVVMAGRRRLVDITEAPLGEDGRIAGYAIDRTAAGEITEELNRHIASHEEILHKLGTAIAIYDADERLKFFNHAFVHLWQQDETWLRTGPTMGEMLEDLRDKRKLPETGDFPAFKRARLGMFTSLVAPIEDLVQLPDGKTIRSVVTPHPFGGLLLTWEDVTDNFALERSYNTLIAVQRETLNNLHEGIAVIGGDGRLQLSNPVFGRMWRLTDDLLDTAPHISEIVEQMPMFIATDDDWPAQKEEIIALLTDREGSRGRLERADGSILDYATVPLPDGAVLLSYLDVSDTIRVERALRERNEALETADRLKSEFIANVSYELRTPLNTIIGFAELLNGNYFGELNERQSEYSDGILDSSNRLLSLINDILDLATIESGHMALELETVDLHELLTAVLGLSREWITKKNLKLEFDCPDGIGSISADERRLKQALFNILSNAVKFTPENGTIGIAAQRGRNRVSISFTDTGIGISDEDQSRVFARFERGSSAEARRSGAGLGLSLVKSFIELHGGEVALESRPGVGTKVTCVLPTEEIAQVGDLRVGTG